jgi:hypothetical protein
VPNISIKDITIVQPFVAAGAMAPFPVNFMVSSYFSEIAVN